MQPTFHRFVEIPFSLLEQDTLHALLEEFVTRQGYDTTSLDSSSSWVEQLITQLKQGRLVIVHDIETQGTEVLTLEDARQFLALE